MLKPLDPAPGPSPGPGTGHVDDVGPKSDVLARMYPANTKLRPGSVRTVYKLAIYRAAPDSDNHAT